jgi:aminoglycoside phosphotransferase (APT) family kinase protein
MPRRVALAWEWLSEVERLGLWSTPPDVSRVLASAEELGPAEPTAIVHGDLHFRHVLVGPDGSVTGVIDWGDVCRAEPSVDLPLFWSFVPPCGRDAFLERYGAVSDGQLLRARALALGLSAILALYGHADGLRSVEREAVAGLERAAVA